MLEVASAHSTVQPVQPVPPAKLAIQLKQVQMSDLGL